MEEIVVEGLDYEDFVFLKSQLAKITFSTGEIEDLLKTQDLIDRINQILEVFN